ncbi:MAG TPA: UDP-N-acetylglucosamine 1-carboxyvinyltransferase [Ruminococcaceae bacterium]|nr:UDP-N-acetylglucosamine 1-carboxyvinyltransferase [Oscillospiraceae bacterium]HBG56310.1 UDP-N-acetylglucosamine 1-carboxyvinyltransferase [Oscillospiraceae bacterium]HBQ46266.1 UDP-N-acetylglucosamine 1-carboxyvinyltransferase [Oscillospiraceae bacterium]HBT91216.1 UDP-N-acetylglucosamine 1-carboxyvinyltransferase [Oscillospiraceae bacterium]HCB92110.1 UDP-N-acetylglucosamine 1-carboxyvinyltransferase [Oscillospiraceae bacterium]
MDKFVVQGGCRLTGEVPVSGAKNAAIAIIPAAILSDGVCRIENVPNITDVASITRILYDMGAGVRYLDKSTLEIDPRPVRTYIATEELARHMRGSYYLLGALLGRFHHAVVTMPGGCDLGVRPIDQHLKGFAALGAKHRLENGMVDVSADRLTGNNIYLDVVSVGATANIMLAAVKAEGTTVIENAAKEPHIVDLANFLNSMGADIRGAGTDVIKIYGVRRLSGTTYSIIPDPIEAGTYMVAAAATCGDVLVKNVIPKHLESISAKLEEMGVSVEEFDDSIRVKRSGKLNKCNIKTMPHPGFPTDMQPQMCVLLSLAQGTSIINESVWDNRFRYVDELKRMGAQISVDGKLAVVEGVDHLEGAPVKAPDLRAGAALVIAALCARGTSQIENIAQIERGYENIDEKIRRLGGDIRRVPIPQAQTAQAI